MKLLQLKEKLLKFNFLQKSDEIITVQGRIVPRLRESLMGGRSQVPTNLAYANERNIDGLEDVEFSVKDVLSQVPKFKEHAKVCFI